MLKYITLTCALFGLLVAISLESWLRKSVIRNDQSAKIYTTLRSRYSEFWSVQWLPLIIMLVVVGAAIAVGAGILNALLFLCGAVLSFISVNVGSRTVVTGSITSSTFAEQGDIRSSLRAAYRSASVMGLSISSVALIGIGLLFLVLDIKSVIALIASFGLGASVTSICIGLSGAAYSGSYALSVKSDDYTDYTGSFIGSAADNVETYVLSVCAVALLSGVAVDTSSVTSTFTMTSAARYPLIVLAAGIVASVIGIFAYRGHVTKDPSAWITYGNYIAAVLIAVADIIFSHIVLQSYVYGICVASGMVAALISAEISRNFSSDGRFFKKNVPSAKSVGASQSMIYSLSMGMMTVVVPVALTGIAMIVSFYFASYYGIALTALGISSMSAVNSAVRGFSINTASASEIVSVVEGDEVEGPTPADVLLTAYARTDVIGKTYSAVSTSSALVALYCALSVVGNIEVINLLSTSSLFGMLIGAVSVFAAGGLIIRSIRLTSVVLRDKLDDIYNDEKNINFLRGLIPLYLLSILTPFIAGFFGGINGSVAFALSCSVTGMCVLFTFNNSGKYFDRMATETIGTVLKIMIAFTLVFAPFFTSFGGVF